MTPNPPPRTLGFAGRQWWVKRSDVPVGSGPNRFDDSPDTVALDPDGDLVLRVRPVANGWVCAEVVSEERTGYGRYEWIVRSDLAGFDRHVVCGLFVYGGTPGREHRELDVEVSAWSLTGRPRGQFVVQPYDRPGHLRRFPLSDDRPWRCSLMWSPGRVVFGATGVEPWTVTGAAVPVPDGVHARLNLWLDRGEAPARASSVTLQRVPLRAGQVRVEPGSFRRSGDGG